VRGWLGSEAPATDVFAPLSPRFENLVECRPRRTGRFRLHWRRALPAAEAVDNAAHPYEFSQRLVLERAPVCMGMIVFEGAILEIDTLGARFSP
jgi:hypothetical protein